MFSQLRVWDYLFQSFYEPPIRRIGQRNGAPEKIYHKTHRQLFDTLKGCIKIREKIQFVKKETHGNHDEYVDLQEILSQGTIEVDGELKQKLGNFKIYLILSKMVDMNVGIIVSEFNNL
jgi:hypothetical protein